jgi:RNA polymerase sigma-70 factor (ECF subfamily)
MPHPSSTGRDSDDRLIERVAAGDPQAFALLFRLRHRQVHQFALHMTGLASLADDVAQDVFMVVMRDAARYEPGRAGVAAWLCGIARNCARQRLGRERHLLSLDETDGSRAVSTQADPLVDLTRAEGIERVRKAVLSLPVRYREVVVLCDLQEMSYADAAETLACAVGTVRSRLHRGRQLLAGKLSAIDLPTGTESESKRAAQPAKLGDSGRLGSCTKLRGSRSCA